MVENTIHFEALTGKVARGESRKTLDVLLLRRRASTAGRRGGLLLGHRRAAEPKVAHANATGFEVHLGVR